MKVHVLGLAHSHITAANSCCPFATNTRLLVRMLRSRGHEVTLYATPQSDQTLADKFVPCVSEKAWERCYGDIDTSKHQYELRGQSTASQEFNRRMHNALMEALCENAEVQVICATYGVAQATAASELPSNAIVIESGVGYCGSFCSLRVFPSYAWMHYLTGCHSSGETGTRGHFYDAVIPHALDPAEFTYETAKDDYFVFMGRINEDKGYIVALDACKAVDARCLVAGQLPRGPKAERATLDDIKARGGEYVGAVGPEQRAALLAGAKALFCPSLYIEPFGYVAIEAQVSGTPVICTDWGGFTETVEHGVTGYRCRSFNDFVLAVERVAEISHSACRERVLRLYSMERVAAMYDRYLAHVCDLHSKKGWYKRHDAEHGFVIPAQAEKQAACHIQEPSA